MMRTWTVHLPSLMRPIAKEIIMYSVEILIDRKVAHFETFDGDVGDWRKMVAKAVDLEAIDFIEHAYVRVRIVTDKKKAPAVSADMARLIAL